MDSVTFSCCAYSSWPDLISPCSHTSDHNLNDMLHRRTTNVLKAIPSFAKMEGKFNIGHSGAGQNIVKKSLFKGVEKQSRSVSVYRTNIGYERFNGGTASEKIYLPLPVDEMHPIVGLGDDVSSMSDGHHVPVSS